MKKYLILFIALTIAGYLQAQSKKIYFEERFETILQPVKVHISLYQDFFDHNELLDTVMELKQGGYHVNFSGLNYTGYLLLTYSNAQRGIIKKTYYLHPGDSVLIQRLDNQSNYAGRGSRLFQTIDSVESISMNHAYARVKGKSGLERWISEQKQLDTVMQKKKVVIENARTALGNTMTEILLLDAHAACWRYAYELFNLRWSGISDTVFKKEYLQFFNQCLNADSLTTTIQAKSVAASYPAYVFTKAKARTRLNQSSQRFNDVYQDILHITNPDDRQKLVLYTLTQIPWFNQIDSASDLIKKAARLLTDSVMNKIFRTTIAKEIKGMPAYDFSFFDLNGEKKQLHDFIGKTVLLDFWFTGCIGCKQVAPYLKEMEDSLQNRKDIVFVSVSIDGDKSRWTNSVNSQAYGSINAVNLYTGGKGAEDPFLNYYSIIAFPTLMIIDKYGNLYDRKPIEPRSPETSKQLLMQLTQAAN